MINIDTQLTAADLAENLGQMWALSAQKLDAIEEAHGPGGSTPVITRNGIYVAQDWTEWTRGFQFGSLLLQFDATGDTRFLARGRSRTLNEMPTHVTHFGVHDHGFNNISTYGALWRLGQSGKIDLSDEMNKLCELAICASGAVQAYRWTPLPTGGYIYSFNGPHSLFADTIRSLRALVLAHKLGHEILGEGDAHISLLERAVQHAKTTADYAVFYGEERDAYDIRGRVAHESIFNIKSGAYRCPNSQQGYSPFTTWTRGLSWIMLGFAEELECFAAMPPASFEPFGGWEAVRSWMEQAARASCDFYIEQTPTDGIPYWDTGAPGLHKLGDYLDRPAEPHNDYEPVDSSAASTAAQGMLILSRYLAKQGDTDAATRYRQAGLTVARTLLSEAYLSSDPQHQGLILHSIYHRPNDWDTIHDSQKIPSDESSLWGDYHMRELGVLLQYEIESRGNYHFFDGSQS